MIDRGGEVWDLGYGMVALVVRSYLHEKTGNTVHLLFFIDRVPPDTNLYPAIEELFSRKNPATRIT